MKQTPLKILIKFSLKSNLKPLLDFHNYFLIACAISQNLNTQKIKYDSKVIDAQNFDF